MFQEAASVRFKHKNTTNMRLQPQKRQK